MNRRLYHVRIKRRPKERMTSLFGLLHEMESGKAIQIKP